MCRAPNGEWARVHWWPSLIRGETRRKAPPFPYFSPTSRALPRKIVSRCRRRSGCVYEESHQGEGDFVKSCRKLCPTSVRPAGLESLGPTRLLPGRIEPPLEVPCPALSPHPKPHVDNLLLPALASPRTAAVGGRGPDAEPARKTAHVCPLIPALR